MWHYVWTRARQCLSPALHQTRVLLFVNKQDDNIVAVVQRVCSAKQFDVRVTTLHDADPELLAAYMITSVPVCIVIKPDQWTYIVPDVTEHNLQELMDCITK